jgi:hypothetical protein
MATSGLMFLWAAPSGVPSFNANCSLLNSVLSQPQIPDQPNLVGCPLLHRASPPTHSLRPLGACPCPQWGIILPQSFGQRHTSAVLFSEGLSLFSVPPHSRLSAPTRRNHLCFSPKLRFCSRCDFCLLVLIHCEGSLMPLIDRYGCPRLWFDPHCGHTPHEPSSANVHSAS